jgi:hypothetical protein
VKQPDCIFSPISGIRLWEAHPRDVEGYRLSCDVWRFNPWTGTGRTDADVGSDPHGLLIWEPSWDPLPAASKEQDMLLRETLKEERQGDIANTPPANDVQHGGDHYKSKAIQPWDYITSNHLGYLEGNIVKYVSRWRQKGGVVDLQKAQHYLQKLIELEAASHG